MKYVLIDEDNRVLQVRDLAEVRWMTAVFLKLESMGRAVRLSPNDEPHADTLIGARYNPDSKTFHLG